MSSNSLPTDLVSLRLALRVGLFLIFALVLGCSADQSQPATGEFALSRLVADGMVMQRDLPVPLWGWGEPGTTVEIQFDNEPLATRVDAEGRWQVTLPPRPAGGPHHLRIRAEGFDREITGVMVGDVWLCSGQSNMEWPVSLAEDAEAEIAAASDSSIRHFAVPRSSSLKPEERLVGGEWTVASPETVGGWTAVGYFFARELRKKVDVPIGLIHSSWGGSRIEPWMSAEALGFESGDHAIRDLAQKLAVEESLLLDKIPAHANQFPTLLYHQMIHPILNYPVRGVLWYQGESNTGPRNAVRYRRLFPGLIEDWRRLYGLEDLPFLFVQLANFMEPAEEPGESDWAVLRESQAKTLELPRTAQVVTIDIGDADDIHPRNKQDVGLRLSLAARHLVYGEEDLVGSGPTYRDHRIEKDRVVLTFDHVGGGLSAEDGELQQFAVAGADRKFVWANARIDGDQVIVQSDAVPEPIAVRYAWSNNPEGANFYNADGLPASPFRTDSFPTGTPVTDREDRSEH